MCTWILVTISGLLGASGVAEQGQQGVIISFKNSVAMFKKTIYSKLRSNDALVQLVPAEQLEAHTSFADSLLSGPPIQLRILTQAHLSRSAANLTQHQ